VQNRRYYSVRTGKHPNSTSYDLDVAKRLFRDVYNQFVAKDYFQEAFGYFCVDNGEVAGSLGSDIKAQIFRRLLKENLWPIEDRCLGYSEDDLFDITESLYDCASKPVDGHYHTYSGCGWHYEVFDRQSGRSEFRAEINYVISQYNEGYELSEEGEILTKSPAQFPQFLSLLTAELPTNEPDKVEARVREAELKFRRQRASWDERRDAIRDLADVLEYLRPKLKEVLTKKDESDLFNIANNFGVRHHNEAQKTDYDMPIWYSWMFYCYLATIHAVLRLIEKNKTS